MHPDRECDSRLQPELQISQVPGLNHCGDCAFSELLYAQYFVADGFQQEKSGV